MHPVRLLGSSSCGGRFQPDKASARVLRANRDGVRIRFRQEPSTVALLLPFPGSQFDYMLGLSHGRHPRIHLQFAHSSVSIIFDILGITA